MSTQPIYDRRVDHPPLIVTRELPPQPRQLTWADVGPIATSDPWWDYELFDGSVWVSSRERSLTWMDLEPYQQEPLEHGPWAFELIEGTLIVRSNNPRLNHQRCVQHIYRALRPACPDDLEVVTTPFSFSVDDRNSIQPDVLVARRPIDQDRLRQAPVLAVEVLSPSTRRIDLVRKRSAYERQGVANYWIVEPDQLVVSVLALTEHGYREVAHVPKGQRLEVTDPFPVVLDPADLHEG
jgi:Uma2 family endonuclease